MDWHRSRMDKQRILKQFVDRTGLEPEAAADILAGKVTSIS